jgi:DNA-binding PadR family transcriptional regulator
MNLKLLDEGKANLRILTWLIYSIRGLSTMELIEGLKADKVGKSAFYSSLEKLASCRLVYSKWTKEKGKRIKLISLTDKGVKVGEKLVEIEKILAE